MEQLHKTKRKNNSRNLNFFPPLKFKKFRMKLDERGIHILISANFLKKGNLEGAIEKDFYGNPIKPFTEITRKPLAPDENEVNMNSRARSAKLRIGERND